ncbi:hypothetical protein ABIE44_002424 [Marmoricola sp. OAE513]|uniref:hypothetical protein n=1 Tax=Marmoricola sp. OAE513 TaxID=2817894 RepID=UPI001AE81921
MRLRLSKPTPAFVVAVAALAVCLGGTSYAVATIGSDDVKNGSLTGVDIKDGSLRGNDVANGSLRGRDIANGSLTRKDFSEGTLLKGDKGSKGDTGPKGDKGDDGDQGLQGVATRWALIDEAGAIIEQSGGFTVSDAYVTNNNIYIDAHESLVGNGVVATIAIQNQIDRDPVADGIQGTFSGEISASRCNLAAVVCAPAGTNNNTHFVVSPRNSDGTATSSTTRKRFYVVITGNSSDYVAPAA